MRKTVLTFDQFKYSAPVAGINSKVLTYTVPVNSFIILRTDKMMKLRLTASQVFNFSSAQSSDNVTVAVDGAIAQIGTVMGGPSNPGSSVVGYWHTTSPSASTKIVQPIDISGSQITFAVNDTTSTEASLTVYYLLGNGSFSWVISAPVATGNISANIYGDSLSHINSLNQTSPESAIYFPEQITLPQEFSLSLYIQSTPAVDMALDLATQTPNTLAGIEIPILTGTMSEILQQDPEVKKHVIDFLLG